MEVFNEKKNRCFCFFLIVWGLACALFLAVFHNFQGKAAAEMLAEHDRRIVSSLLEQGISPSGALQAVTSTEVTEDGKKLIEKAGISGDTAVRFLPLAAGVQGRSGGQLLAGYLIFMTVLLAGAFIFLREREKLYLLAISVTQKFLEGNFTMHLPRMNEGNIYRLFGSVDSLANALQSKQEAEHKGKEFLKNIISDISHQLKTPLSALKMYNEIISGEPENTSLVEEFTEKSSAALDRIEQLIGAMLKITRLDTGNIVFEKHPYQMREIVLEAVGDLKTRAQLEEKYLTLEGGEEMLVCDLRWTAEAVGNLVKNALDHTDTGGHIRVSWGSSGLMMRLCVEDNGCGIREEDFYHIFKRFYRSQNSRDKQGTGLGLPLAKSIIEGQGGILSVKSTPGLGTSFTISFLTEP